MLSRRVDTDPSKQSSFSTATSWSVPRPPPDASAAFQLTTRFSTPQINQVPTAVDDFDGYVRVFGGFVNAGLAAADCVFVVWDEPGVVTRAKLDEQRRRDMARAKTAITMSADLAQQFAPTSDDYGLDVIDKCNPHELLANRPARGRFYDALCKKVSLTLMAKKENAGKTLTFDGIDERGASRPAGVERDPGIFSTSDRIEDLFTRGADEQPIGEGDLKMPWLEGEIQALRNEGKLFKSVEIIFVSTIDTDSIAIELMHQSAKNEAAEASREQCIEAGKHIKSVLCFRETTGKRKGATEPPVTLYACLDLELLHGEIMKSLFGKAEYTAHKHLHRAAIALLSAGWSLCGCDFLKLAGLRSDAVWSAATAMAREERSTLNRIAHLFNIGSKSTPAEIDEARREAAVAIGRLVELASEHLSNMPRMARASASSKLADSNDFFRAAWVTLYWSGFEMKALEEWGFV